MAYLYSLHPVTLLSLPVASSTLVAALRRFIGDCDPGTRRHQEIDDIVTVVSSSSDGASFFDDVESLTPAEARICFNAAVAVANGMGVTLVNLNTGECLAIVDDFVLHLAAGRGV